MRHNKNFNHLGRKTAHRKAMLSNMACSLIEHKRISTTVAKAKALRQFVEPLVTRSKEDTTHSRRVVFSALGNKYAVSELFRSVGPKVASRDGGYTRIIRTGNRLGDNAEMCMIELVDFNDIYGTEAKKKLDMFKVVTHTPNPHPRSLSPAFCCSESPAMTAIRAARVWSRVLQ